MGNYVKTPTVFQMEATECGAASLSMIFEYFGRHISLEQMRIDTGTSRDGCNAGNIMRAAKKYGFECHGYRKGSEALRTIETPCIIYWNSCHFVVFEGFRGKFAFINDPAVGRRRISAEELEVGFSGTVLTFRPGNGFTKEKNKRTLLTFAKERLAGQQGNILIMLFVGLLLVFPGIAFPVSLQIFIDEMLVSGKTDCFVWFIPILCGTILLQAVLTLYRNKVLLKLQKRTVLLTSREFLHSMFRLPISFFDQRYVGDLSERVSNNAGVCSFLLGDLADTILSLIFVIFYFAAMCIYSPILAIIAVSTAVINAITLKIASERIINDSTRYQQDYGKLAGTVYAGISVTSSLKAAGSENEYTGRILGFNEKAAGTERNIAKVQDITKTVPAALTMLGELLILLIGGLMVINGRLTVGMLAAFFALFLSFSDPVRKLAGVIGNIQKTKADAARTDDILTYGIDSKFDESVPKADITTKLEGAVRLEDISFGYNRLTAPVISGLSINVQCGSSIAIIGVSGSGKSTISKIISGLYEPWSGEFTVDGIHARSIPKEVLNASISTVSQNITLFSGSIRDNLTMWNDNIAESDMIAAAKDACIHDVISQKPGAYDFCISEGASNLSGGERQRLEIARALATNPTVLIMDEATSSLDSIVEKKIMDNIKRRGCTCIVIAHRLSAIRDCDQIAVMSSGKIIQKGTHEELSAEDGPYKEFIRNM